MFFELRQYHIRPGQRDKWVKCMEEEIIPFQVKMGMVILGSFVGEEDESVYVWIRRFESEAERKRLYDAVYQSDYWKNEIAPRVPTLIDREQIKVTRLRGDAALGHPVSRVDGLLGRHAARSRRDRDRRQPGHRPRHRRRARPGRRARRGL